MYHFVLILCVWCVKAQEINSNDLLNNLDLISNIFAIQNDIISSVPNGECKEDLFKLFSAVGNHEIWGLKMVDSWAKPQMGLLTGNIMHIGNYDECLEDDVDGQYCSVIIKPTVSNSSNSTNIIFEEILKQLQQQLGDLGNIKTSFGICTPKSCSPPTLQEICNKLSNKFNLDLEFVIEDFLCDFKGKKVFTFEALIGIIIFFVIISLIIVATIYDLLTLQKKGRFNVLISISAYENTKKIFSTTKSDENISCLNGIKFISMLWIILGHKYMIIVYVPYINTKILEKWVENPFNSTIIAASFAVDTFFLISGLLVSYTFFKHHGNNFQLKNFNILKYWMHRLIRLTPSLAALILFLTTLVQYFGNGPLWDIMLKMTQSDCKQNWWAILLYVQNYVYPSNNCASQAWYLAVDTQMYFLAPILLIPLVKWPRKTIFATIVLIVASIIWAFCVSWNKDLDLMYYNYSLDFYSFYISTHFRASSWLIGLILGYFLFTIRNKKLLINKKLIILLWIISICVILAVVFGHFSFIAINQHSRIRSSIFNAFSRPAWCLAICWIIFACSKGFGGVINRFLSLKFFEIGVKISYGMYLLHVFEILYTVGMGRVAKYFSNEEELKIIWSDYVTVMFFGLIWVLIFELPPIRLEKLLFNYKQKNKNVLNGIVLNK
nr:nose resistant to fluoxetine protein 6-like isoform X1 [Onthophagus taurus]